MVKQVLNLFSQESQILLSRIVEYYNFVHGNIEKCILDIISGQLESIDADLKNLLENFSWLNFGMVILYMYYVD